MSQQEIFLGRQPILDSRQRIVAYELLFRSSDHNAADFLDPLQASAQVIAYAFGDLGIGSAIRGCECFINVDADLLKSDLIELLPREQVTLEILEDVVVDGDLVNRCRQIKEMGFRLALDDFVYAPKYEPLLECVDVVKVDLALQDLDSVAALAQRMPKRVKLLAEKVETMEQFRFCRDLGFQLFQGYYFARPHLIVGRRADPAQANILRLIKLIMADAETADLAKVLKQEAGLCYNLFRLVNSVALRGRSAITTIPHAITMLGRRQLQHWLQLLIYAQSPNAEGSSPLLQMACARGKLMELLAAHYAPQSTEEQEKAYMAGIFSLLDVLLDLPMAEVLQSVPLHEEIQRALLERQGHLGIALNLCEQMESGQFTGTHEMLANFGISAGELARLEVEALRWANSVAESIDSN